MPPAQACRDALRWALDIAEALEYLHGFRPLIVHRDLKLENILLTSHQPAALLGQARRLRAAQDDQGRRERGAARGDQRPGVCTFKRWSALPGPRRPSLEARLLSLRLPYTMDALI